MSGKDFLLEIMPAPIALAWAAYEAETWPFSKLLRLVDSYEALLKYASILAVQNFYAAGLSSLFPQVDNLIRERIAKPGLGDWAGFLREVLRCFADRERDLFARELFLFHYQRFDTKPRVQGHFSHQGASEKLLALRNRLAHGATLGDADSLLRIGAYRDEIKGLLQAAGFLSRIGLFYIEEKDDQNRFVAQSLMGSRYWESQRVTLSTESLPIHHVVAYNAEQSAYIDLHPLLVYVKCQEEILVPAPDHSTSRGKQLCGQFKLFYYNELKNKDRVIFLDYWRGHFSIHRSPNPLVNELRASFPETEIAKRRANWFAPFIRKWTASFVGRESTLETITHFAQTAKKHVLVVIGAPGIGKTALLAKWAEAHNSPRHFIRERDFATHDMALVFENLGLQLSESYQVDWVPPSSRLEKVKFRQAFEDTLQAVSNKIQSPFTIIIDGVDEASRASGGRTRWGLAQNILDYLPDPALLPEHAKVVLSIRPELLEHPAFATKFSQDKADYVFVDRLTDVDVRALLYQVRSKYEVLTAVNYLRDILRCSEGNPLYLHMLLDDLAEGRITFGESDSLPAGVVDYFDQILRFIESEDRARATPGKSRRQVTGELSAASSLAHSDSLDLLTVYCLVKEPLTLAEAGAINNTSPMATQESYEIIRSLLERSEGRFHIFHSRFRDYFLNLDHYTDAHFHRHADTIERIRSRIVQFCRQWQIHSSPYALRYFSEHLREAHLVDELFALARNSDYRSAQLTASGEDPAWPLRTLQAAITAAAESDRPVEIAEFLLAHAAQLEEVLKKSPLDALWSGNLAAAWTLADMFEPEERLFWYLLLAWELRDQASHERAMATIDQLCQQPLPALSGWQAECALFLLPPCLDLCPDFFLKKNFLPDNALYRLAGILQHRNQTVLAMKSALTIMETRERRQALYELARTDLRRFEEATAVFTTGEFGDDLKQGELYFAMTLVLIDGKAYAAAHDTAAKIPEAAQQAEVLLHLGTTEWQAGQSKEAIDSFASAADVASQVKNEEEKNSLLTTIALTTAETGQAQVIEKLLAQIDAPAPRDGVLHAWIRAQLRAGGFGEARQTAQRLRDSAARAAALLLIARAQAAAGDSAAARRTFADAADAAAMLDDRLKQSRLLLEITVAQAEAGDFDCAKMTAVRISDASSLIQSIRAIADKQVSLGDISGARETFLLPLSLGSRVYKEWVQWARVEALGAIAQTNLPIHPAQRKVGDGTRQVEQLIPASDHRESLSALPRLKAHLRAGGFGEARQTAQRLRDSAARAAALLLIARAQAAAGDSAAARRTFADAADAALALSRYRVYERLFVTLSRRARKAADRHHRRRVALLVSVAEGLSSTGDLQAAKEVYARAYKQLSFIHEDALKDEALSSIISSLLSTDRPITEDAVTDSSNETEEAFIGSLAEPHQAPAPGDRKDAPRSSPNIPLDPTRSKWMKSIIETARELEQRGEANKARLKVAAALVNILPPANQQQADALLMLASVLLVSAPESARYALAQAFTTAKKIEDDDERARILWAIAALQADANLIDQAKATGALALESQPYGKSKKAIESWCAIAMKKAQAGVESEARAILDAAFELTEGMAGRQERTEARRAIIRSQLEVGHLPAAIATVKQLEQSVERTEARSEVIRVLLNRGMTRAACELATDIGESRERAVALQQILEAFTSENNFSAAEALIGHIHDPADRTAAWQTLAIAQSAAGLVEQARKSFAEALESAKMLEWEWRRVEALQSLIAAMSRTGAITAAMNEAHSIPDGAHRGMAYQVISATQAEAGDFTHALETANQITEITQRVDAIRTLARLRAKAGELLSSTVGSEAWNSRDLKSRPH